MQKNILLKVGTIIPPIMLASFIMTSYLQQDLIEKLRGKPSARPEQHCEVFPTSDSFGLMRDNRNPSVTGTYTYAFFGGNNHN